MITISVFEHGKQLAHLLSSILPEVQIETGQPADITIIDDGSHPDPIAISGSVILLNGDAPPPSLRCCASHVITYGVNPLSTVTYSSVEELATGLRFCYCLQRGITLLSGQTISGMDIPVVFYGEHVTISQALCVVTAGLLCSSIPAEQSGLSFSLPHGNR